MNVHEEIAALNAAEERGEEIDLARLDERIADRNEEVYAAALAVADDLFNFLVESGEHLTCAEIETMAGLYEALGRNEDAKALIDPDNAHASHDEEGDMHFTPKDPCARCGHSAEAHGSGEDEGEYPDQPCDECDCDRWTEEEQA